MFRKIVYTSIYFLFAFIGLWKWYSYCKCTEYAFDWHCFNSLAWDPSGKTMILN